jgi:multidrug efflux pump
VQRTQEVINRIQRIALGDDTGKYQGPPAAPGDKRYPGVPGIAHTVSVAGMSFLMSANGSNFGSTFLVLEPFDRRKGHELYDEAIAAQVSALFNAEIEDAVVSVFRAPPIQGLGNAGGFQVQVEQRGFVDLEELQLTTDDLVAAANQDPRFAGVFTLFRAETPQIYIKPDRTKCEALLVDVAEVNNTLQVYMGGYFVNLFNKFGRTWQVIVMAEPRYRTKAEYVSQLKVRNKLGEMVPLGTVVDIQNAGGPVLVMRYNMYASAAVFGANAPGTSSGQAIQIIEELADRQGATIEWTGMTEFERRAGNVVYFVFGLGTLLVYLVLAAKYESWSLPVSVILVVPMCVLCAVTGMMIASMPIDIFVQVGLLVLVAMAAKNAVLIVEFAEQLRREGKPMMEAVVEACRLRLRPILMTSFAFIGGVVPLMLGRGAGAEMRVSLGTAVFAGMVGVTIFGILLTPVFYYVIMKRRPPIEAPPQAGPDAQPGDVHIKPA